MQKKLMFLNISPMIQGFEKETAADIIDMYNTGVITENAFIMSLVPEADPPVEKGELFTPIFSKFREALGKTDMPIGILLQSTMGHGWTPAAKCEFQKMHFPNGFIPYTFCPLDQRFLDYVSRTVTTLAKLKPDFFMLDDDTRFLTGRNGCFCPLHLEQFNAENGTGYDFDSMREAVQNDREIAKKYDDMMKRSVIGLARTIRKAIDSTDPSIPCSFCQCARDSRHAPDVAKELAAPGQEITIRINNGLYMQEYLRALPEWLWNTERQIKTVPENIRLLAEPDTCPQNNYSTSASRLHFHLTNSLLSGCRGGKLWLTRTSSPEFSSGKRYRKKLSENRKFYETVTVLAPQWSGITCPLPSKEYLNFPLFETFTQEKRDPLFIESSHNWLSAVIGKMGIPFKLSPAENIKRGEVVMLAGDDCKFLNDDELNHIFSCCSVITDGRAAAALLDRGFGKFTGITGVTPIVGKSVAREILANGRYISGQTMMNKLEADPGAEILSQLYHKDSAISTEQTYIAPGAVLFKNSCQNSVITFAASLHEYSHAAFGMLNETRKEMLINIISRLLPGVLFAAGDDEVMFRYGRSGEYELLSATDLSLDPIHELTINGGIADFCSVEKLKSDGSWEKCGFSKNNGVLQIDIKLLPIETAILRIK